MRIFSVFTILRKSLHHPDKLQIQENKRCPVKYEGHEKAPQDFVHYSQKLPNPWSSPKPYISTFIFYFREILLFKNLNQYIFFICWDHRGIVHTLKLYQHGQGNVNGNSILHCESTYQKDCVNGFENNSNYEIGESKEENYFWLIELFWVIWDKFH